MCSHVASKYVKYGKFTNSLLEHLLSYSGCFTASLSYLSLFDLSLMSLSSSAITNFNRSALLSPWGVLLFLLGESLFHSSLAEDGFFVLGDSLMLFDWFTFEILFFNTIDPPKSLISFDFSLIFVLIKSIPGDLMSKSPSGKKNSRKEVSISKRISFLKLVYEKLNCFSILA